MPQDFSGLDPSVLRLHPRYGGVEPSDHFVEFYDDDRSLAESVGTFISIGITEGDTAVVIADPQHIRAFESELRRTFDLDEVRDRGKYVALDAEETLSLFMEDGLPDPVRFGNSLGELIHRVGGERGTLRVFAEMVAVLWAQGNVAGALALEDLWNQVARSQPLRLFCAYPTDAFRGIDQLPLAAVCDRHSHIVTSKREAL